MNEYKIQITWNCCKKILNCWIDDLTLLCIFHFRSHSFWISSKDLMGHPPTSGNVSASSLPLKILGGKKRERKASKLLQTYNTKLFEIITVNLPPESKSKISHFQVLLTSRDNFSVLGTIWTRTKANTKFQEISAEKSPRESNKNYENSKKQNLEWKSEQKALA